MCDKGGVPTQGGGLHLRPCGFDALVDELLGLGLRVLSGNLGT